MPLSLLGTLFVSGALPQVLGNPLEVGTAHSDLHFAQEDAAAQKA